MLLQDPDDRVKLMVIGAVVLPDPSVWENGSWCLGPSQGGLPHTGSGGED